MPERNPFAAVSGYLRNHRGISLNFSGFYFAKLYQGWVEWFLLAFFKDRELKARGCGRGGEVKRLSAAHSRSALDPVKESPSPSPKRSSSSLELVVAFCFFKYRFRFWIFCSCSSVKDVQILQGVSKVTQGSSPLPASLQVGQKLCLSKLKQKWRHFCALGLSLFA